MDPRLSLVTLGVADLDRAIAFYEEGLELPMQDREPDSDIAFFELGDLRLALYPRDLLAEDVTVEPAGEGFAGITLAHNVESTERVDAVLEEAVDAGAALVKPAQEADWGGYSGYSGYFADPDGHLWEVAYNPYDDAV